eukprot:RCo021434
MAATKPVGGRRTVVVTVVVLAATLGSIVAVFMPCQCCPVYGVSRAVPLTGVSLASREDFLGQRCYTRGKWTEGPVPKWGIEGKYLYNCDRTPELNSSLRWRNWEVEDPLKCGIEPWNTALLCMVLRGRSIVFYGDSLLQDIATSFLVAVHGRAEERVIELHPSQLYFVTSPPPERYSKLKDTAQFPLNCDAYGYGSPRQMMHVVRGATLFEDRFFEFHANLQKEVGGTNPPVIVIAVGAHYAGNLVKYPSMTAIVEQFRVFRHLYREHPIIWITQSAGHPKCWEFPQKPLTRSPVEHLRNNSVYGWHKIEEIRQLLIRDQPTWSPHHVLLDQAALLMLRPDMHTMKRKVIHRHIMDCLHFCVSPSPLDVTVTLLLNTLRFV